MREWIAAKLRPGTLLRQAALLTGGAALGQLFLVLVLPILSRLYSPEAIGVYGTFLSVVAIGAAGGAFRYETAIIGAPRHRSAWHLLVGAFVLTVVVTLVAGAALTGLRAVRLVGDAVLPGSAIPIAMVAICLTLWYTSLRYWHLRMESIRIVSGTAAVQSAARAGAPLAWSALGTSWLGLVAGDTIGRIVGMLTLARGAWRDGRRWARGTTVRRVRATLRRFREYPLVGFPSAIIDSLSQNLPVPLVAAVFGPAGAGHLTLVLRAIQAPMGLIARSVGDVYHSRLGRYQRTRPSAVPWLFLKTSGLLAMLAIVPSLLLLAAGESIFVTVFGEKWRQSGAMAASLVPWVAASFCVAPVSRTVLVLGGQRLKLVYDIVALGVVLVVLGLAMIQGWTLEVTVWRLSLAEAAAYLLYYLLLLHIAWSGRG